MHLRWDAAAVLVRRERKNGNPGEGEWREGKLADLVAYVVQQPIANHRQYLIYAEGRPEPLDATHIHSLRCRPDFPD